MELYVDTQYKINDREFNLLRELIKELTGINLTEQKKMLVVSRLSKRLRQLGLSNFTSYYNYIMESEQGRQEIDQLINRITTNKTDFYREPHHFKCLTDICLPQIYEAHRFSIKRKLRIWSAGCSSGEEPYTIAITLAEFFKNKPGWDIKILATDLDTEMLDKAKAGIYKKDVVAPIPEELLRRYFLKGVGTNEGLYMVKKTLKDMIIFKRHNLVKESLKVTTPFDIIFCRNVIIYFDSEEKARVINRFYNVLRSGGFLFLGHSESLLGNDGRFKLVGNSAYCKK
ncbi:MAG: protein-glutamate O-methyltransferase [Actinomycetota bacterium]|nr:protein-glutamate O-methyltransferase [Actinomycetota bacterium]